MIIQIYGLTTPEDVGPVVEAGVDHIGINTTEGFPTWDDVDIPTARAILAEVPPSVRRVVLSLSTDADHIVRLADTLAGDIVHVVHIAEAWSPDAIARLRERLGRPLMCTVPVRDDSAVEVARRVEPVCDYLLLDSADPATGIVGASGLVHDWTLSRAVVEAVSTPVILAGGLGPENVTDAIAAVGPAGVDSETRTSRTDDRRRKDIAKVRRFVDAVRSVR
jgi:phosphoribosylanthranilate isomerase